MPKKLTKKITVKGQVKKPKKKKKMYFGKEAHQAIVDYQNAKTEKERNDIYTHKIKPSFEKLSENLIFIHGFAGKDYSLIDTGGYIPKSRDVIDRQVNFQAEIAKESSDEVKSVCASIIRKSSANIKVILTQVLRFFNPFN